RSRHPGTRAGVRRAIRRGARMSSGVVRGGRGARRAWTGIVAAVALAALSTLAGTPAIGAIIGGGGNPATDCLGVFSTPIVTPGGIPNIRCKDGDSSCDADGIVNGECVFPIAICANGTSDARCTLNGVSTMSIAHSADNGDPKFDTSFQALQSQIDDLDLPSTTADDCTSSINVVVKIKGPFPGHRCRSGRKFVQMSTRSTFLAGDKLDGDGLRLRCIPATAECDPHDLFPTGTFERIQQQIFNDNCAVSGCHVSQSQTGGLLLEAGSSYDQTVNHDTTNGVAAGFGWKRITVLS